MSVASFNRTLDQELAAIARGASFECLVCGEFLLKRPVAHACLECELVDRLQDRQSRTNRALGVVLVRLRDPEGGHDRVTGELLDDATVGDHAMRDAVEERLDTAAHNLRIRARDKGGGVHEIDEQDRR